MKVNDVLSDLTSAKIDWDAYLANARYIRRNNSITWRDYERIWLGQTISAQEFVNLVDRGQYSFQVVDDGSVLQLLYEFDATGERLLTSCLGFYGAPVSIEPEEPEPAMLEEASGEIEEEQATTADFDGELATNRWLRIDFARGPNNSVVHGECHMHVGGLPGTRFLMKGVPGPAQFIEWIMALFYPEMYQKHRLGENGEFSNLAKLINANRQSVGFDEHDFYRYMTHLVIPVF